MPKYCDFVVEDNADMKALGQDMLTHLFLSRIKFKKPTIVLITGDSGEGKSYIALKIAEYLLASQGLDLVNYVDDIEIFTPHQYAVKMDKLLNDKKLKNVKVVILDEAREVVDSKTWYNFVNRAIAHINAMFRRLKPMVVIIVTQYTGDVDKAIRKSITYWGSCTRPLGHMPSLKLYRIWKDERDIENPKLRKRRVFGYIKRGNKQFKIFPRFTFSMPPKAVVKQYEDLNYGAKAKIIKFKLEALIKTLEKDFKDPIEKAESMAEFYANKPELLSMVIEKRRGKIVLRKEFDKMHELTNEQKKEFHKRLINKLIEKGVAYADKTNQADTVA